MTLNTSQSKDRGIGPTTSLSPTVRANSRHSTLPKETLTTRSSTSSRPNIRAVRLLPLRLAAFALALDAQKALQQKCLALPLRSHFCQMALLQYLIRDIHIRRDNATGSALTEPAARLGLPLEERTSATAHRSFRLRRMPRFTPRSALSIRQRIVAHAVLSFVHHSIHVVSQVTT
jgi:hypothetical protein